jgi:AAA+ ATPase superfamily predicted ATPase
MRSPFKFLDSYGFRDKDVFFGREEEVEALYTLVFKTPLTLLYGLSGTGKTSIIQCGLANRFEGPDWLPFFIRREQDINQSLRETLLEAVDGPPQANLPDLISTLFDDYLRPVYLIFDQFEELFILGSPEEQARFAHGL